MSQKGTILTGAARCGRVDHHEFMWRSKSATASMLKAGMPAEIVEGLLEHYQIMKLGHTAKVSNTVEEITGKKATSFETLAHANKEAFIG